MEVIGRVESGTETESNAGAVAEDVRSEKAPRQLLLGSGFLLRPTS